MSNNPNGNNQRFRFTDRITLVTDHGSSVIVNNKPLHQESEKQRQIDLEAERESAYRQGWADCEAEKGRQLNELTAKIRQEREAFPQALNQYLEELEGQLREEVVTLSFRIAEYLLERECRHREDYRNIILQALKPLPLTGTVKVFVHPELAEAARQGEIALRPGAEIIADPSLHPGEVRVSSNHGLIDGTFAGRLGSLREALAETHDDTPEETP